MRWCDIWVWNTSRSEYAKLTVRHFELNIHQLFILLHVSVLFLIIVFNIKPLWFIFYYFTHDIPIARVNTTFANDNRQFFYFSLFSWTYQRFGSDLLLSIYFNSYHFLKNLHPSASTTQPQFIQTIAFKHNYSNEINANLFIWIFRTISSCLYCYVFHIFL